MSNEIYTLDSIRKTIELFVLAINSVLLDVASKVGVMEGGFTDAAPWLIRVTVAGDDLKWFEDSLAPMEFRIFPQQFLDMVDHGGGVTRVQYSEQMFRTAVEYMADNAKNPEDFIKFVGAQLNIDEVAGGDIGYGIDTANQSPN